MPFEMLGLASAKVIICFLALFSFTLIGCANIIPAPRYDSPIPAIDSRLFGKRPKDIVSAQEIFAVSEQQRTKFLRYFNNQKNKYVDEHRRVANYVEQLLEEFEYSTATLVADETLSRQTGDCMSLATMTTALASIANVGVSYKTIDNSPFYDQRGDVVIRGNHVRSVLHKPGISSTTGEYFSFRPSIYIDFFPSPGDTEGQRITVRQFIAMFYRNLAAKALWENDYEHSFWLLMEAVSLAPYDHDNINMLAILHRRTGHQKKAEELYLYGLENTLSQVTLLRNYRILLRTQNRLAEVKTISDRLAKLDDQNPFNWIYLAEDHFVNAQYKEALYFYRKAQKAAPHLHHAYQGLSKTLYKQGKTKQAEDALREALALTDDEIIKARYLKKLNALKVATR